MWSIGYTEDSISGKIRGLGDKVIINDNGEIVFNPYDMFSDEFLNNIIDKHNEEISKTYEKGLKDGVELVKELR